jgi:hypothetical protein
MIREKDHKYSYKKSSANYRFIKKYSYKKKQQRPPASKKKREEP